MSRDGTPFGQYRLLELLGRGGMGEVWRAYDTVTDRVVALKVLPANFAEDSLFQERFRREAHAAAQLNEPHVVPIHTYGQIDGRLYVDMRLIEGRDLQTVLAAGPLPPERAVRIIEQVARAVHAAHKVGLVHRDIKPSNILLDEHDFAYLIDFGIARAAGETGLTATGGVIGTLGYMAPERFSTGQADARSDIYALACVLYECLTGRGPFPGESLEQQLAGHLATPPPRPSNAGAPSGFDSVIATGMAKNPAQRYSTTVELARAAQDAVTTPLPRPAGPTSVRTATTPGWTSDFPRRLTGPPTAPTGPPPGPPSRRSSTASEPPMEPPPPQQPSPTSAQPPVARRSKRWIVPAAAVAVTIVVGGGLAIWQGTRPSTAPPISATTTPVSSATPPVTTSPPAGTVVDFRSWQPFGGIDAQVSDDGRSVLLDTHDTTKNWKTVWSGLISPAPSQCTIRIAGQARDISHSLGVPGGFGIGLTTLRPDAAGQPASYGSAVQYDFGLNGYFAVAYPTAQSYGLVTAPIDHNWHNLDVSVDAQGWLTAQVDGKTVLHAQGTPVCGMPTIRVWAGSAEFREFSINGI
jgi:serine/threonine protein kinase